MPSGPEWFIVLAVVLVIFGGSQLPKLARNLGKAQKEFKDGLSEGQKDAEADVSASTDIGPSPTDTVTMSRAEFDQLNADREKRAAGNQPDA
jgi:sec-independent protein translocase protein TatA